MRIFQILVLLFWLTPVAMAQTSSLTYSQLEQILKDPARKIKTIDSLLAQPEFSPNFLKGFTAVYASHSLQGASPLNPRVILYGEDASLIMAFTCAPGNCLNENSALPDKDLANSSSLEVIHWVTETKSFEFRRIDFPEADLSRDVVISEANPKLCMGCHMGPDPRPNWQPYEIWPGVFGGNDDHLFGALLPGETKEALQRFLDTATTRPRYQHLNDLLGGYQNDGTRDRKEHNIDLTSNLNVLNATRIVNRISQTAYYQNLKFSLAQIAMSNDSFYAQLTDAGLNELAGLANQCVTPTYPAGNEPRFKSSLSQVARLFYALNEPTLPWFMSFGPSLRDEMVSPNLLDRVFSDVLLAQDPSISQGRNNSAQFIRDGWKQIAQLPNFKAGLEKCIADSKP